MRVTKGDMMKETNRVLSAADRYGQDNKTGRIVPFPAKSALILKVLYRCGIVLA